MSENAGMEAASGESSRGPVAPDDPEVGGHGGGTGGRNASSDGSDAGNALGPDATVTGGRYGSS